MRDGDTINNMTESPDILGGYLCGRCKECNRVQVMYGDFNRVGVNTRSAGMGNELIYTTHHWLNCPECGSELDAKVEFHEYPRGFLQATQIQLLSNVEYYPLLGMPELIKDIEAQYEMDYQIRNELEELQYRLSEATSENNEDGFDDFSKLVNHLHSSIEDLVIVLGPYEEGFKDDLISVKSELENQGYDAFILEDLPDMKAKSVALNALIFSGLARFCILIDSIPSGHIKEHTLAKHNDIIVARLFSESSSSALMKDDKILDYPHLEAFEYDNSPLDVVDEAIQWAEDTYDEFSEAYKEGYSWL